MSATFAGLNDGFCHEAFFYSDADSFLAGTLPFLRAGVAGGDGILVVESEEKTKMLRSELGRDAESISFADMAEIGANPARIIPAWRDFVDRYAGTGRRLRGIGEPIWKGRSPEELIECQRHESLLNVAFATREPLHLLCPYDAGALAPEVIEEARRSHAFVTDGEAHDHSQVFRGIDESAAPFDAPLPQPRSQHQSLEFTLDDRLVVQSLAARYATASGLSAARASAFVMAVNEVATNSVRHGGGTGRLKIWQQVDRVICEISDAGHLDIPLADRARPPSGTRGPRGLWFANQLCDLVQIRSFPTGTVVRLHVRRLQFRTRGVPSDRPILSAMGG